MGKRRPLHRWIGKSAMGMLVGLTGIGLVGLVHPGPNAPGHSVPSARRTEVAVPVPSLGAPAVPGAGGGAAMDTIAIPGATHAAATDTVETARAPGHDPVTAPRAPVRGGVGAAAPPTPVALAPGRLFISSRPWGRVYVDDRLVGVTPLAGLALAPGTHHLRVAREGFTPYERTITIAPAQAIRLVDLRLQVVEP